jgi:LysM repeat protein
MAYNPNSYFNYEAGRGSIYSSPPKSKPKNANQQAAKSMGSAGIGGLGGKPTTTAAQKIQDNFREQTQKDSGSTYDEIALPTEAEVDKGIKKGLGSPDKSDDDNKDQTPLSRIKSTFDSVSEMMGLGKPEKPKRAAYTPEKIYSTAAFRARSNDPIDLDAQNRRINAAVDFGNRAPMAYLPAGGTYDEITKQRGADERSQQKMAESINATIAQLYAANDPARQFYQSGVPMDQRIFEPELGYDEVPQVLTEGLGSKKEKHKVKKGDTLSEIAQDNGTTVEELVRLNDIEDKDVIDVGQEIKLSDTANVNNPQTRDGISFISTDAIDNIYTEIGASETTTAHLGDADFEDVGITLGYGIVPTSGLKYEHNGTVIELPDEEAERWTTLSAAGVTEDNFDPDNVITDDVVKDGIRRDYYDSDESFTKAVMKKFQDRVETAAEGQGVDADDIPEGAMTGLVGYSYNTGSSHNYNDMQPVYEELTQGANANMTTVQDGMLQVFTTGGIVKQGMANRRRTDYNHVAEALGKPTITHKTNKLLPNGNAGFEFEFSDGTTRTFDTGKSYATETSQADFKNDLDRKQAVN